MDENFRHELKRLLNMHSRENVSDTADYILAEYMLACLEAYEKAVKARDKWFNIEPWKVMGARWGMSDDGLPPLELRGERGVMGMDDRYTLPDEQTIIDRLLTVRGLGGDEDRVIRGFAHNVGNGLLTAEQIVEYYRFAVQIVTMNSVPAFGASMHIVFPEYMTALFGDLPKVAEAIIAKHRSTMF